MKISEDPQKESMLRKDRTVIRAVPYVAVASALLGAVMAMFADTTGQMLQRFCSAFVLGFAVLGIYSFIHKDRGMLDGKAMTLTLLLFPMAISLILVPLTDHVPGVSEFLEKYMPIEGGGILTIFFFSYFLSYLMMFAGHGVISTVVAYFRNYTARIYLSIEKIKNDDTDGTRSRISRWVYGIPDIIDIERIEMEPVPDAGRFPLRMFSSLAFSIFVLGLALSSYIFLNPIFEMTLSLEEAVIVTVVLTFFVPVLVIPWFITRETGAKIKSQARDYYLWKGMRRRLFEGFFAVVALLSLLAISMFLGNDMMRTSYTYAAYIGLSAFLSVIYAFVYSNYYHQRFKEEIVESFTDAKR